MDSRIVNLMIKDSAMIVSNTEQVLSKPALLNDDFKVYFKDEAFIHDDESYRLSRIYYKDTLNVIYVMSAYFELTDNVGEINVEYIKED